MQDDSLLNNGWHAHKGCWSQEEWWQFASKRAVRSEASSAGRANEWAVWAKEHQVMSRFLVVLDRRIANCKCLKDKSHMDEIGITWYCYMKKSTFLHQLSLKSSFIMRIMLVSMVVIEGAHAMIWWRYLGWFQWRLRWQFVSEKSATAIMVTVMPTATRSEATTMTTIAAIPTANYHLVFFFLFASFRISRLPI